MNFGKRIANNDAGSGSCEREQSFGLPMNAVPYPSWKGQTVPTRDRP